MGWAYDAAVVLTLATLAHLVTILLDEPDPPPREPVPSARRR